MFIEEVVDVPTVVDCSGDEPELVREGLGDFEDLH